MATDKNDSPVRSRRLALWSLLILTFAAIATWGVLRYQQVMDKKYRDRHAWGLVLTELSQLNFALGCYKERTGEYPPRPNPEDIERHIAKAFPKWLEWKADFRTAGLDVSKLDDSETLVFWLGGMTDQPGSRKFIGFSVNPRHPLEPGPSRIYPFFEFDESRLVDADGDAWWEYVIKVPPDWRSTEVRFDGKSAILSGVDMPSRSHRPNN